MSERTLDYWEIDMQPWENLANAIILQAITDYKEVSRSGQRGAATQLRFIKKFFSTEWYRCLTTVPGDVILKYLEKKYPFRKTAAPKRKIKRNKPTIDENRPYNPQSYNKHTLLEGYDSAKTAAQYLDIDPATIYKYVREGKLKGIKANGILQVKHSDLQKFVWGEEDDDEETIEESA